MSTVLGIETHHDQVRVALSGPPELTAAVTHAAIAELKLVPGQRVWMSLKATDIAVHPA